MICLRKPTISQRTTRKVWSAEGARLSGGPMKARLTYHITPAAALSVPEDWRGLRAALEASYRRGRWFESIALNHVFDLSQAR
jgi:hypothetical protein